MKKILLSIAKGSWFALLMLVVFAYMAAGLSDPSMTHSVPSELAAWGGESGDIEVSGKRAGKFESSRMPISADDTASIGNSSKNQAYAARNAIDSGQGSADAIDGVVSAVNEIRTRQLLSRGLPIGETADWLTVSRRMSLAMLGSGMSLEEIRRLEQLPVVDRNSAHLDQLLRDPRFHDYWAERWARFLVGADEGPFVFFRRRRFRHWLAEQIAANETYDKIVRQLITSEGLWTDRPEVNFLTVTFDSNDGEPDPIRLAARTSRAFLGLRIDCLQCHDDFLGNVSLGSGGDVREGEQADFHQLAAFFSAAKMNGLQGVRTMEPEYKYQYLDADEEVVVEPTVPYGKQWLPSQGDARDRLATWITHAEHRQFARAAVTRFWALMYGRSPTEAVDDLPLDAPLPEMLGPIVDDFLKHRDSRRTIQIIARSDAFRVSSVADFEITPQHENEHAVFPLVRLRAEQVAGSIAQASRIKSIDRDSSLVVQLIRFGSINDFLVRYGDLGENEFAKDGITIPQRLVMINGEMLRESAGENAVLNASSHIQMFARENAQAVDSLFLCVLNRYPTADERKHFVKRMADSETSRLESIIDLFWTLANSTEFAWNH